MEETTTADLAKFGYREIVMARDLLNAWVEKGLPDDFDDEEVKIMFNTHSGNVFLTNEQYQTAMVLDGELYSFYSCLQCGKEGFDKKVDSNGYEFVKHEGYCSKDCNDKNK